MGGAKPKKKSKPASKANAGGYNAEPEEIQPHRKIYVGNLPTVDMTEAKLTDLFKPCGDITSLELVLTAKHAFGFVEFATIPEAECAIEKMNGQDDMVVKFAKPQLLGAPVAVANASAPAVEKSDDEEEEQQEDGSAEPSTDKAFEQECAAAAARKYASPVESLVAIVQKAIRATSTADCISYTVKEVEDEWDTLFECTVELKVPAGSVSHIGKPHQNKKDAKKAAAEAALHDVSTHRLLPALPPKVKEPKVEKAADSDDEEEGDSTAKAEEGDKARIVKKTKKQEQQEKAELKAKKLAQKKAGKAAAKAAAAEIEEEESSSAEEGEDEDESASEEVSDQSQEESEEESEDDSSDDGEADEAEAAKKAAVKAALAARRAAAPKRVRHAGIAKEKSAISAAQKLAEKAARAEIRVANDVQGTLKQENFGQTKFIKP